ncbi:unnamed protein product [Mytilus coruscus]|uniref:Uncharacterized protein n=1 Tax=Mytilus coruscus TaxID=42192 RepID=A0A6J8BP64_MYTCO|nr:unnamed protein product [Mytilus coruscus]
MTKVSCRNPEGVLWITHFQPLNTENSEIGICREDKGNVTSGQQRKKKQNKSTKTLMTETFECEKKQTNNDEIRTHLQRRNPPSANLTNFDYTHQNTVLDTNTGCSRGRGRGRGKKNHQRFEMAGRPFQTLHPDRYQGDNTEYNTSVGWCQGGYGASHFSNSNCVRSFENMD